MNPPLQLETVFTALDPQLGTMGDTIWTVYGAFQDRPRKDECFMLKFYRNGLPLQDTLLYYNIFSDEYLNGQYYLSTISALNIDRGDSLDVVAYSVTREYYDWYYSVIKSQQMPMPFIGSPPANAFGNVDGGSMGFFLASSVSKQSCRVINMYDYVEE